MKKIRLLIFFGLAAFIFLFNLRDADSIPAFARKYQTSCATCHYAFPKLNAFGVAYRWNGFRFPGGQDQQMTKEKPISMGAEAYKELWPSAIWPSTIPYLPPVSAALESQIYFYPYSAPRTQKWSFDDLMSDADVLLGGTLGDKISFFGVAAISEDGAEVEMGEIVFTDLLKNELLNFKIGKFPPDVLFISDHRRLGPQYWITTRTVGNNLWSLESTQKGIEVYGLLIKGRMLYDLGMVEGRANLPNSQKDFYVHAAYKFYGMPYNGISSGGSPEPWIDNSLQLGTFFYIGTASLAPNYQRDRFYVLGADLDYYLENLNFLGGFSWQKDEHPFIIRPGRSAHATNIYLEADYLVYPWLIPTFRYERFEAEDVADTRLSPTLQTLIRANLKAYMSMQFIEFGDNGMKLDNIAWGLVLGI